MGTLVAQHEGAADALGRAYGVELLHDPAEDYYTARFHIRTYDGIRVESSWASEEIRLDGQTKEAAWIEAGQKLVTWWKALNGASDE